MNAPASLAGPAVGAVTQAILGYLREEIAYPGTEVNEDTDLFDDGVLDSLGVLRLVLYLEQTYGITFAPEDLSSREFARVPSLSRLVLQRAHRDS